MDFISYIPPEVFEEILVHLPLDGCLMGVVIASKHGLAPLLFTINTQLTLRHFRHQFKHSGCDCIWNFLELGNIKYDGFRCLPFSYQAAIYGEILRADPWTKRLDIDVDVPSHRNLMSVD
ncbi:UNVERIFIED_CONTAM: hypothetical protein HDU68_008248, partial [Siphonaria sp. JEL0065]